MKHSIWRSACLATSLAVLVSLSRGADAAHSATSTPCASRRPWQPLPRSMQCTTTPKLALRGGGKNKKKVVHAGTSSFGASIFNLVNNVAGAGILALSAGQAKGTGWIPSIAICTVLGMISAKTFTMIGDACELTGQENFKGLWGATMGEKSTYLVDSTIAILCLAVAVIYSGILGDVMTSLFSQFGVPSRFNQRTTNIAAVTLTALLPLSLIKNLSALAFTSVLGFSAIMYTVLFITVRALDGSYKLGTGRFVSGSGPLVELLPSFTRTSLWNTDFSSLVLASNLGLAYIAHYNAPIFYRDLKDVTSEKFRQMVNTAFAILVVLYNIIMAAGYSTFGDVCHGNILLNYHPKDILSTLGRIATFFSILFGFPLVATGAREGIIGATSSMGVLQWVGDQRNHVLFVSTMLLLVTAISCTVTDVSLVVGLTGAAMGSFIVYICPALLYAGAVRQVKGPGSLEARAAQRYYALIPFGVLIGALGVYMTLTQS